MNARRMMTRITTTNQKKNTTIPGIAYPATVLALATDSSYPAQPELSAISYGASPEGSAAASAGTPRISRAPADRAIRGHRDRAERGTAEPGQQEFRAVLQVDKHPVAGPPPAVAQPGRHRQRVPRERAVTPG